MLGPSAVWAEEDTAPQQQAGADSSKKRRAKDAYDQALAAANRGDLARAAQLFSLADQLAPNAVTLTSALKAAVEVDDPTLGMELVERAGPRATNAELTALVRTVRERFEDRAGQITLRCGAQPTCVARIDGEPVAQGVAVWVTTGRHDIEFEVAGLAERQSVTVAAGATEIVEATELGGSGTGDTTDDSSSSDDALISPAWFGVGLGLTVTLGVVSIVSAVDTEELHDEFEQTGQGAEDGEDSQTRTNILFFSTVGLATATTVLGLLAVPWGGDDESDVQATAAFGPDGLLVGVGGRF